jgi:hypothetical protein
MRSLVLTNFIGIRYLVHNLCFRSVLITLTTGEIQVVELEAIWFQYKLCIKSLPAYTYLDGLSIYVNSKANLAADEFNNSVMRAQTPPFAANSYDKALGIFIDAGDLEPRHHSPSGNHRSANLSYSSPRLQAQIGQHM